MSKYTPGPWRYHRTDIGNHTPGWAIENFHIQGVGCIYRHKSDEREQEIAEANARLITAAPELLEMMKRAVSYYEQIRSKISLRDGYPDPTAYIENLDHYFSGFKAVIAKAEGGKNE